MQCFMFWAKIGFALLSSFSHIKCGMGGLWHMQIEPFLFLTPESQRLLGNTKLRVSSLCQAIVHTATWSVCLTVCPSAHFQQFWSHLKINKKPSRKLGKNWNAWNTNFVISSYLNSFKNITHTVWNLPSTWKKLYCLLYLWSFTV